MASASELVKPSNSPSKVPSNKHIIPAESICINKQLGTGEFGIVQQGVWTNGTERVRSFFMITFLDLCSFTVIIALILEVLRHE